MLVLFLTIGLALDELYVVSAGKIDREDAL